MMNRLYGIGKTELIGKAAVFAKGLPLPLIPSRRGRGEKDLVKGGGIRQTRRSGSAQRNTAKLLRALVPALALFLLPACATAGHGMLAYENAAKAHIAVYRPDAPAQLDYYTLAIAESKTPIAGDNRVNLIYNGVPVTVTCDGSRQPLGGPEEGPDALRSTISCRVADIQGVAPRTAVTATVTLAASTAFAHAYEQAPGNAIDPDLGGATAAAPYCATDGGVHACKWQAQNLGDPDMTAAGVPNGHWVVFARTRVDYLTLGYDVADANDPVAGQMVCAEDPGLTQQVTPCQAGEEGHLCPRRAVACDARRPAQCPGEAGLDPAADLCLKEPDCPAGGFVDRDRRICIAPGDPSDCPDGYADNGAGVCAAPAACPDGMRLQTVNNRLLCAAAPTCGSGSYNSTFDGCYPKGAPCPLGPDRPCITVPGRGAMCDPVGCAPVQEETENDTDKKNDGNVDGAGNCKGAVRIFNGETKGCRSGGWGQGYKNCCRDLKQWFGIVGCRLSEKELAQLRQQGLCIKVGRYCKNKFLGFCTRYKTNYCCFKSKLARIIHEQGRPQLKGKAEMGFGTAQNPNCWGFTPDEFSMLDFSRIDLSEWYEDIIPPSSEDLSDSVNAIDEDQMPETSWP